MVQERGTDRRETIDELRHQHPATVRELLPPKPVDGKVQKMRLVFLARSDAGVPAGMRGRTADATCRPLIRLVAGIAPAFVVVSDRPTPVQVSPDRRIAVGQGLRPYLADERGAEVGQAAPVAMRPAELTMQALVTAARQHRGRWSQRAPPRGGTA